MIVHCFVKATHTFVRLSKESFRCDDRCALRAREKSVLNSF